MTHDAIVIGGGVSGLVAALDLHDAHQRVVVVDAAPTLGGSVARGAVGLVAAELGADAFAAARSDLPELAKRLGLTDQIVVPRIYQAYLRDDGINVALPPSLMGIPLSYDDIADLLGVTVANEARQRDAAPVPDLLPESFGMMLRQRLGDAVVDKLVDPVVSGVHASRADTVETASILSGFDTHLRQHGSVVAAANALRGSLGPAGAPVAGFRHGMSQLIDTLTATLHAGGVELRTDTPVTAVQQTADGWQVASGTETLTAPVVVVALPALAAGNVLRGATGPLGEIVRCLAAFHTTDVTLVALHVTVTDLAASATPIGSGVLIAPGQNDIRAKAATHVSAKWDDVQQRMSNQTHLFRLSYGGTEPLPATDDASLTAIALSDLAALLHVAAQDITLHAARVIAWQGALTRPHVGRMAAVHAIDHALTQVPGLSLVGNAYAGNGLAGVVGRARREVSRILVA